MALSCRMGRRGTVSLCLHAVAVGMALALPFASSSAAADSAMFRGGAGLTGAYEGTLQMPVALSWRYTAPYSPAAAANPSSPAVRDGVVYFSVGNRVYAVTAESGEVKWRFPQDEALTSVVRTSLAAVNGTVFFGDTDGKLYALRDATATVESTALIAASIMSKKLAVTLDALVLDVKVGTGAFMKRQVDARKLAQIMTTIARRADLRAQALITDMSQPLGFAIGNALEIMEVSQTLQNAGPSDLTRISLELAARMIHLGKLTATIDEARELAQKKLLDGSGYQKLKQMIQAQGGNPQVLDRFELLPNATGAMEITSPRGGYISAIDAEEIGLASGMIGAGRDSKEDLIDAAVGVVLEVKAGQKVDEGSVLCRIYFTNEERVSEAAERVEDAFRISAQPPEPRELILDVVG